MMKRFALTVSAAAVLASLSGCAGTGDTHQRETDDARDRMDATARGIMDKEPKGLETKTKVPNLRVHDKSYLSVTATAKQAEKHDWLASKRITLTVAKTGMLVEQLISHFGAQGVRIASRVPVTGLSYRGLGVSDMDAESAVKVVFGSIGLDVDFDDQNKTVLLKPLETKTWFLGIANRKSTFRAGRAGSSGAAAASTTAPQSTSGSSANALPGLQSVQDTGSGSIEVNSDFWKALKEDLKARVSVMMPRMAQSGTGAFPPLPLPVAGAMPALPPAAGQPPAVLTGTPAVAAAVTPDANANSPLEKIEMGTLSINEETGAVSVQAPSWLLEDIDRYMLRIIDSANTTITFTGEIIAVETNSDKSSGLDLSGFGKFAAGRWGALISNNPLGGVTVSFPSNGSKIPSLTANASVPGVGSLVGIKSDIDGLSIFNAYLSQFGMTKVLQRPVLATTSSVPGEFQRITTKYYNNISQTAASGGTGSAAVGTTNSLVPVQLGTLLRVVPLFNPLTRTVRTQLSIQQSVQTGVQNEAQMLTVGNTVQQITTAIPIVSRMSYAGETVLRDGDLIIVGGMVEDSGDDVDSGILGLDKTVLSPITRQGKTKSAHQTYYIALRVAVEKKE